MPHQFLITAILLLSLVALNAEAATPVEAGSAVTDRYQITTTGFFGDYNEIGSVLTPRREGLKVNRPSKAFKPNVVKNRQLAVASASDIPLGNTHDGALKQGERLYLYGVATGVDYVQLDLYTVATYVVPGMRGPTPLQASVRFLYDGGLAGVSTRQILDDIGEWLVAKDDSRQAASGSRRSANTAPAARATSTVRLGQTREEVTLILGPPEKQILLGAKTIFIYPDVKVLFMDGKVTDAE
jgi:hypothetical protein